MSIKTVRILVCVSMMVFWFIPMGRSQDSKDNQHIKVAMRMIGHRTLMKFGDTTSRVLPITQKDDRYTIQFATEFVFQPEELVSIVDSVVRETKIATKYLVEVKECQTSEIVYGFEAGIEAISDIIPCQTRPQPKGCYSLIVTLLERPEPIASREKSTDIALSSTLGAKNEDYSTLMITLIIGLIVFVGLIVYIYHRRRNSGNNTNQITIGEFEFDRRNMRLAFEDTHTELTSKEADLLFLLHSSANEILERELILKIVWGDEGAYIGRTLDVFISKLRKKLEADPNVKITNVRGVGYKLVLNPSD